jgi:streptogramin lyase
MADWAGNLYIADKDAHSIRKVRPDGTIVTVAGINNLGNGPDAATPGTQVALNEPNGLFVLSNGTVHILDLQNGKIRRLATNGMLTTVVAQGSPIASGRGLWVSEDESLIYYAAGTAVKRWRASDGLSDYSTGYSQLGNIAMDPVGRLVVTDRTANRVYRIEPNGSKTVIAGKGGTTGGGDGALATATGLNQVRAVCYLPTGGCLVGTDAGGQVWYVDPAGTIRLFLHGDATAHAGDGPWFYAPDEPRVSKVRQITVDPEGNLLIAEHDAGYIRKVRFLRYEP